MGGQVWSDALQRRLSAALGGDYAKSWWTDPRLAGPEHDDLRLRLLLEMEEAERSGEPRNRYGLDALLQHEAETDLAMPAWIKRPWHVPVAHMLAAEALLVETVGMGYSASTGGGKGTRVLRGGVEGLGLLVYPVPGHLPSGIEARAAEEERLTAILRERGLVNPRILLWNDVEPPKAFHGLIEGIPVRNGCVALGIVPEPAPRWDIDDF